MGMRFVGFRRGGMSLSGRMSIGGRRLGGGRGGRDIIKKRRSGCEWNDNEVKI